ncbi:slit homolog 1 protein-like [Clytia hemisphaerica]|uniref:slit homolog 1 protein-like n=1 Tax=Clytia hemisphaerica TaxID=252671 RepID=UPI0034D58A06
MNMLFHHLLILLACIVSSFASRSTTCPTKCECSWEIDYSAVDVYCMSQNITNKDLLDIASQSDTKKTVHLFLNRNLITEFQAELFVNFTKLDRITLNENQLTRLPANISLYIPSITILDLEDNNINKIKQKDFEGYDSIISIFLQRNGIENLEPRVFQDLSQLEHLYAEGNKLTTLRKGTFTGLAKLRQLFLARNDITTVETGVFGDLPSLSWIYLQFNKITTARRDWFGSVVPDLLGLENNPLICDCVMYDTINYFSEIYHPGRVGGKCNGIELADFYRKNKLNCSSCSVNECQNDATCQVIDQFNYNCSCSRNNHGEFCQFKNACSFDLRLKPCREITNSICVPIQNTFKCDCRVGYSGERCQMKDICYFDNPCQNDGICQKSNISMGYTCQCNEGYHGQQCQLSTPDTGFIILMVVLAILVLIGLVGLAIFFRRRRRRKDNGEEVNMSQNKRSEELESLTV